MTTNQKFLKNAYLNAENQIGDFYEKHQYDERKVLSDHDCFMIGANYVLQLFNSHVVSSERNEDLKQREGETAEKYQARLRDDIIEAMCSNRGYASCLRDE
jgi:hypothetical protein